MLDGLNTWQIVSSEFACNHENTIFAKFIKSNGVVCVRIQCLRCGTNVKEVAKRGHDTDKLPLFDEQLRKAWYEKQQARHKELFEARQDAIIKERANENEEWWKTYNEYLHTQQWHDMRKRVLERDGYICQACLKNKATQAHHLSYDIYNMIGRSAAFELVAICYQCHRTIHPHMAEAQHNVNETLFNPYMIGGNNGRR